MATVRQQHRTRLTLALRVLLAGALLAGGGTVFAPASAAAQGTCQPNPPQAELTGEEPWERALFGLDRLSPVPDGQGVTVAVVDSGVDADHPQLQGRVEAGNDFLPEDGGTDGRVDCDGHGTAVASVIAAAEADEFAGLAEGATILPVRVAETQSTDISPDVVAEAIIWATDQGADIINLSLFFFIQDDSLADAVQYALDRDVIVVAAVSERTNTNGQGEFDPFRISFPANYDGVVGVSAIDRNGLRLPDTHTGLDTDLLAPGVSVRVARAGSDDQTLWNGTSFAAPFVSAAAALVLSENPDLSGPEVVELLKANADPVAGLPIERNLAGVVNPYRALTGRVAGAEPIAIQPPSEPPVDPAVLARAERWERAVQRALIIVLVAVFLTALGFIAATIWRRGQRLRWLPSQRRDPVFPHAMVDEPERLFYTVPTPRSRD